MKVSPRKILPLFLFAAISLLACTCAHTYGQASQSASTYEVTAAQYCSFLNKNAINDPDNLFDEKMETDPGTACILRFETAGKHSYQVIAGRENFPICYVNSFNEVAYLN